MYKIQWYHYLTIMTSKLFFELTFLVIKLLLREDFEYAQAAYYKHCVSVSICVCVNNTKLYSLVLSWYSQYFISTPHEAFRQNQFAFIVRRQQIASNSK